VQITAHGLGDSRNLTPSMHKSRRPAGDLIDAILANMRSNLEELRYTTIAPSRYTVYVSQSEYARLEGILPRLRSETLRALNEELARQNRRGSIRKAIRPLLTMSRRLKPPLENAGAEWHVEFLPDMDGELKHDQDIIVHSELVLPAAPELGSGERTRRVSTVHSEQTASSLKPSARLIYEDRTGPHQYDVVLQSTTIGRGGAMYPVNVRVATTDEVSREHARIRRSADTGHFFVIDLSTHGTTIDGHALPKGFIEDANGKRENGIETRLPPRARIGLAGTVFLDFEKL
jgi:FHA domain-containing protein